MRGEEWGMVGKGAPGAWRELLNIGRGKEWNVCCMQGIVRGTVRKEILGFPEGVSRRGRNGMDGNQTTGTGGGGGEQCGKEVVKSRRNGMAGGGRGNSVEINLV